MEVRKEQVIDAMTGEVKYSKDSYVPELFNENGYYFWNKKAQSRQFTGVALPLDNFEDEGIFARLCRFHLSENSNLLEVRENRTCRPFTFEDFVKFLGVAERQAHRRFRKLLDSGVIARLTIKIKDSSEEWLVVNPLYFVSGKRINDTLYKLFRNDLDKYLSPYAKQEFAKRICKMNKEN